MAQRVCRVRFAVVRAGHLACPAIPQHRLFHRDIAPGRAWFRGALLVSGMVLLPLLALLHVSDGVPGADARASVAAGTRADARGAMSDAAMIDARRAAVAERSVRFAASRSRTSLLSREDGEAANATTTTAAPPPSVRPRPKPKPVVRAAKPAAAPTTAKPSPPPPASTNKQLGAASFYSPARADECAHRTLPFGTIVTVTNVATGASTTCRIGDRGPFVAGRVIDLSKQRFAELASPSAGVIRVRLSW